jgi:serine/threonine-protein kinase HipA
VCSLARSGIAKAIRLYCSDADPVHVCCTNTRRRSIRLAPLYDVVTTSIYGSTSVRTGITKYDRTLALSLSKAKSYPDRATLVDFGSRACGVTQPDKVLERIADAMMATLSELKDRIDDRLLAQMRTEWDAGTGVAMRYAAHSA